LRWLTNVEKVVQPTSLQAQLILKKVIYYPLFRLGKHSIEQATLIKPSKRAPGIHKHKEFLVY
jgi:hypothetical protein